MPDPCRPRPAPVARPRDRRAGPRPGARPDRAPLGGARRRIGPAPVPALIRALATGLATGLAAAGLVAAGLAVAAGPGAAAEAPVVYGPPVDAPVADPFRPPEHTYGPGNRGLEYTTTPGQAVGAVGRGTVAFAGSVAGRLVVSVEHPDGLRSSLTGLAAVEVAVGRQVGGGERVGTAGSSLHLGVRRGEAYLDPAALFALGGRGRAWLVPEAGDRSEPAAAGRANEPAPAPRAGTAAGRTTPGRAGQAGRHVATVACPPACKPA